MRNMKERKVYNSGGNGNMTELIAKCGGESVVKSKYPAVWKAVRNTRDYHMDMRLCSTESTPAAFHSVDGFVTAGLPELTDVGSAEGSTTNEKKQNMTALLRMRLEDGSYVGNDSGADAKQESNPWPYAALTGTVENTTNGVQVATFGEEYYDTNGQDQYMTSEQTYTKADFANKYVESNCQFYGLDFNDVLRSGSDTKQSSLFIEPCGISIVSHIMVTKPYSRHNSDMIKMLYDREPFEQEKGTIDYSYTNVRKDNLVKTCIPIEAVVQFSNNNEPAVTDRNQKPIDILRSDRNYRPSLFFDNKTQVIYNRDFNDIKKAFIKNDRELNIKFDKVDKGDYWNTDMSMNNYGATHQYETGRQVELDYSFCVNVKKKEGAINIVNPVPIHIQSLSRDMLKGAGYYEATNKGTVYIPPINIRWGCFAAGTRILMADGSYKPVEQIQQGDVLYTEKGPLAVGCTYLGREKSLLCVCTEGGKILRVTHTHPVILEGRKAVPAIALVPGQRVMLRNGGYDVIKWVFDMEYNGYVYNFEFTDGQEHMVEAEGMLAGEFIGQNFYKPESVPKKTRTPQTQAIVEQMSAMLKEAGIVRA